MHAARVLEVRKRRHSARVEVHLAAASLRPWCRGANCTSTTGHRLSDSVARFTHCLFRLLQRAPRPAVSAQAGGAGRRQIDTARAGTVLRYRFCVSSHTTTVRSAEHEAMTWPNSGCAQSTLYTALECRSSGALLCVHCPSAL